MSLRIFLVETLIARHHFILRIRGTWMVGTAVVPKSRDYVVSK